MPSIHPRTRNALLFLGGVLTVALLFNLFERLIYQRFGEKDVCLLVYNEKFMIQDPDIPPQCIPHLYKAATGKDLPSFR